MKLVTTRYLAEDIAETLQMDSLYARNIVNELLFDDTSEPTDAREVAGTD